MAAKARYCPATGAPVQHRSYDAMRCGSMALRPAGQGMAADIRTTLRDGPMTMLQVGVVTICTLLNMIDGFDVLAISFTAPLVAKQWNVDPATLGVLLSAGLAGMAAGSLFLSPLADLVGRRAVVVMCTVI